MKHVCFEVPNRHVHRNPVQCISVWGGRDLYPSNTNVQVMCTLSNQFYMYDPIIYIIPNTLCESKNVEEGVAEKKKLQLVNCSIVEIWRPHKHLILDP